MTREYEKTEIDWNSEDSQDRIDKQRNANFAYQRKVKEETVAAYGGKCVRCGYCEDIRALVIDHINNDAKSELEPRGGVVLYIKLRQEGFPKDRFQLMCYNCNAIKQFERWENNRSKEEYYRRGPRKLTAKSKSRIVGVEWNKGKCRWRACVGSTKVNGKHLGYFHDTREGIWDAAMAYRAGAKEMYGLDVELQNDEEIKEAIEALFTPEAMALRGYSPPRSATHEWTRASAESRKAKEAYVPNYVDFSDL